MKTFSQTDCSNIDQKTVEFCCIIVAAGGGRRFGAEIPKQYLPFSGQTVLSHTLHRILSLDACSECILVIPEGHADEVARQIAHFPQKQRDKLRLTYGGKERADSVKNGLSMLQSSKSVPVMIHDAARPGVSSDVINLLLKALETHDGAAPALPVADALKRQTQKGIESVSRDHLFRIQTPQAFRRDALDGLYSNTSSAAVDDFELAQAAGLSLTLIPGSESLAKITYPEDLTRLETLLTKPIQSEFRMGSGYDVHAFEPGDKVILCGVEIPHDKSLKGHSDADVGWHAVTDALLGAIAAGDIGDHFPPSDPQWKGAPSSVFLKHAGGLIAELGGAIVNVDLTLICEEPKIKPHRETMRQSTCDLLGLELRQVSVKATTTEGLGFEGRREGIAAQAIVSVALPIQPTGARA